MATLSPPFILCPLSESNEFVGMSEDRNENKVILTIGKNIAIRYHLLEQKQEISWTSSRHWFTSPVIYCAEFDKYGAVIDQCIVILWDEDDTDLKNIKKHKFTLPIFELKYARDLGTIVVFSNGQIMKLQSAIETKNGSKNLEPLLTDKEVILETEFNEKSNLFFVVSSNITNEPLKNKTKCKYLREKRSELRILTFSFKNNTLGHGQVINDSGSIVYDERQIAGFCIIPNQDNTFLFSLCSDGFIYKRILYSDSERAHQIVKMNEKIGSLRSHVSTNNPVVIRFLTSSSVVVYGSDPTEEGAVVLIYDFNYDIMISKQFVKLFGASIMHKVFGNIIVPVGLNMLVLSLKYKESTLASILGKHQIQNLDFFEQQNPWEVNWETDVNSTKRNEEMNEELFKNLTDVSKIAEILEKNGYPQSLICNQIIPQAIQSNNMEWIKWILSSFFDIPEAQLVNILSFLLDKIQGVELCQIPSDISSLLLQIIKRPFDSQGLINAVKGLSYSNLKVFVSLLLDMLKVASWNDFENKGNVEHISDLIKWSCVLLDANYTQFVYNDELPLISEFLEILEEKSNLMSEIEKFAPHLSKILFKSSSDSKQNVSKFRVEIISFY